MGTGHHSIDRATVRRLATLQGDPIVSSMYLDVDGAHRPVAATYLEAFEQLADGLRRRARARDDRRVLESVEGDIARMRAWLAAGVDRTVTRGIALFSCHHQGHFEAVEVPVAVRDQAAIGTTPRVRQLLEALDAPEPLLVALVDRTRLRLFHIAGAEVDERPSFITPPERFVDTSVEIGSWERHREEHARVHLREAAARVDHAVQALAVRQLALGGPDEPLAELEKHLHPTTRALVVGRVSVRVTAPVAEIVTAANAIAEHAEHDREAALVEQVRQEAAGEHRGVVGLEATLNVLTEHRVGTLLIRNGFSAPGASCPVCGHLGPDVRLCPICGATNVELEDVVEEAVGSAVAQDAEVEFCRGTELGRFGSIAAIERF